MFNIFGCFSPKADKNGVFIRFENQSNIELNGVHLGDQLPKKDSYRTYNCATNYSKVPIGETSEYKETRGKYFGYNRILLLADKTAFPVGKLVIGSRLNKEFGKEFARFATEEQSLTNSLNGQTFEGLGFPKGKYTFVVVNNEENKPSIKIKKD